MSTFMERLTALSQEKGTKRKELSQYLGIGINQIKRWETNGAIPAPWLLSAIAGYFGVTVDYLLGNSDQKEKPSSKNEGEEDCVIVFRNGQKTVRHYTAEKLDLLDSILKQFEEN